MTEEMTLKESDQAYAPASATNVQSTWFRITGWTAPSKDPEVIKKWLYYQSMSLLSAKQLNRESK